MKTGKIVEVYFEKALETYEHQMQMLNLVERFEPNSEDMQNSGIGGQNTSSYGGGVVWRPTQQHAPIIEGWDMTGLETDIIEETYPAFLTPPKNDIFKQTADDMRDLQFWKRRGEQSGKRQAGELNKTIANAIALQGSIFYETNAGNGFDAVGIAQAMINERQKLKDDSRFMVLGDRANLKYAGDLAGRQTLQGRPEGAWSLGQIGQNVAEFDIYTGSFLPTLAGNAVGAGTVATQASGAPEAGSVDAVTGAVTNIDYRVDTLGLGVGEGATFNVGDKITLSGVNAIGMADKTDSDELMTFSIVGISGDDITVYPKPISVDDAGLSVLEKAYANVSGAVVGATVDTVNATGGKQNIFSCKGAVEVTSGDAPIELLNEFGGMKVISSVMSNGQTMYMAYDGNILDMSFTCRLFTWYGVTVADPGACGSFIAI